MNQVIAFMGEVVSFMRSMIPVRTEAIWGVAAGGFGTLINFCFGEWNDTLNTLLLLMVLDYASGMLAAYINPRLALNSQKGFKGIARKIFILMFVTIAHRMDLALGTTGVCTMTACFYIANEGLSITENAAKAGVPIPKTIKNSLEQLSCEKKVREKGR